MLTVRVYKLSLVHAQNEKNYNLWPFTSGIILNDTHPDSQIVGQLGYREQSISSKWPYRPSYAL